MDALCIATTAEAMDAIAPEPFVETQFFSHFAPRLFMHGQSMEVDGRKHRVAIRPGNVKIVESDHNEYAADGFIEVDGVPVGVIDPERKTQWGGGIWPQNWDVNIAVHPRSQFAIGVFYKNSRTNKLRYMQKCAVAGLPGWIALYSNAFGDPQKPSVAPNPAGHKSVLLVPANALYGADGQELLQIDEQPNRYGDPLPVFKVPMQKCILISSAEEFERMVLSCLTDVIRSKKHES